MGMGRKRKKSKRKMRRKKREDKKARELEEAAARMGFLENFNNDGVEGEHNFENELANDPELQAELTAAERELAAVAEEEKIEAKVKDAGADADEEQELLEEASNNTEE